MRKLLLVLLFMSFFTVHTNADTNAEGVADAFMGGIMQGNAKAAVQTYMQPKVKELLGAQFESLIAQIEAYSKSFGGFEGAELLHSEKLTTRLHRMVYISHTPALPIAYEIFVYKTGDTWRVTSFKFDTDMEVILPVLK